MCARFCRTFSLSRAVFRSMSLSAVRRYPVPPAKEQPPVKRPGSPHPGCMLFELRAVSCPPASKRVLRECSIVLDAASKGFKVCGCDARGVQFAEGWLRVGVPVVPGLEDDLAQGERVAVESPLVSHLSTGLAFISPTDLRFSPFLGA